MATARSRCCFNPRARAGRDNAVDVVEQPTMQFQSTRPRGARRKPGSSRCLSTSFNPRARAGRDKTGSSLWRASSCFNPRARAGRDSTSKKSYNFKNKQGIQRETLCNHSSHNTLSTLRNNSFNKSNRLPFPRKVIRNPVRLGFAHLFFYTMSGPSGSYPGLAPTCSTRRFQLLPRK